MFALLISNLKSHVEIVFSKNQTCFSLSKSKKLVKAIAIVLACETNMAIIFLLPIKTIMVVAFSNVKSAT